MSAAGCLASVRGRFQPPGRTTPSRASSTPSSVRSRRLSATANARAAGRQATRGALRAWRRLDSRVPRHPRPVRGVLRLPRARSDRRELREAALPAHWTSRAPCKCADLPARGRALQGGRARSSSTARVWRSLHSTAACGRVAIEGPVEVYNRHAPPDRHVTIEPVLVDAVLDEVSRRGVAGDGDTAAGAEESRPRTSSS